MNAPRATNSPGRRDRRSVPLAYPRTVGVADGADWSLPPKNVPMMGSGR